MKIQESWKVSPERSVARHRTNVNCSSVGSVIFLEWSWQLIFNYPRMTYHAQLACCDGRGKVIWHLNCATDRDLQETGRLCRTWAKPGEPICLNTALGPHHFPMPGKRWQRSWVLALFSVVSVGQLCHVAREMMIAVSMWALTTALWKINISEICARYINYSRDYVT